MYISECHTFQLMYLLKTNKLFVLFHSLCGSGYCDLIVHVCVKHCSEHDMRKKALCLFLVVLRLYGNGFIIESIQTILLLYIQCFCFRNEN